ncbi:MAG: sulfatase [Bryobacterales bacterium]|nr:sulfatase [Bryobacterales bacterium]
MQRLPLSRFSRFGQWSALACLLAGALGCSPATVDQPSRLNVLLITADDLGLQLSSYGDQVIETPNLDALGASGALFEVAYVAQASCSPSRSAMFTGLYVHSNGQFGLTNASDFSLHPHLHDATMPNILKRAGYRTGIIGKLHVDPTDRFLWDLRSQVNARDVAGMAAEAEVFMSGGAEDPFFLMVNYTDPHAYRERDPQTGEITSDWTFLDQHEGIPATLVEPSEKTVFPFQGIDTPEQRKRVAGYYNEVLRVDVGVGLLLESLERLGHSDDTLVILTGDHGPPFDRGKTTVYEAGLRVPFLVRWPGVSKPARSQAMVSTVDILPTILDATGVPAAVEMQGMSLRPVLEDAEAPWREYLVGEFHMHGAPWFPRRAIRDGRYKLIHNLLAPAESPSIRIDGDLGYLASRDERYAGTPVRQAFDTFAKPPEFELYDLEADPWEFRNVAGDPEHAEALQRMQAALEEWRRETADPSLDPAFSEEMRQRVDSYYQTRLNAAARVLQQPTAVN